MAGAIAGTLILQTHTKEQLDTITVTINNLCNLACDHCYMQLEKDGRFIDEKTIEAINNSSAKKIVIAGKEIGVKIEKSSEIINKFLESGKEVSAITNGTNLQWFNQELLNKLNYLDISFDGGPKTYSRSDYQKLINNLKGLKHVNALHTVYSENIENINDMLEVPGNTVMFSPYLETKHFGINKVSRIGLGEIIDAFGKSKVREYDNAIILIDTYHVSQDKESFEELEEKVKKENLENKVLFVKEDSLELGIVRVTYDGKIMTPANSLNPRLYNKKSLAVKNIDEQYKELLTEFKKNN